MAENAASRFAVRFPTLSKDEAVRHGLNHHGHFVKLSAETHICLEGSACAQLAFVLEGTARVYKVGETGREITLYRVEPGECCILTLSCILTDQPFPAFAVAETELEALAVPTAVVRQWSDKSSLWRHYSWQLVARRLGDVISLVEEIAFRRMDERLERYLAQPVAFPPGKRVKITHQQIATELGTSREVVSRLLKELEQQGRVRLGRGWLTVASPQAE